MRSDKECSGGRACGKAAHPVPARRLRRPRGLDALRRALVRRARPPGRGAAALGAAGGPAGAAARLRARGRAAAADALGGAAGGDRASLGGLVAQHLAARRPAGRAWRWSPRRGPAASALRSGSSRPARPRCSRRCCSPRPAPARCSGSRRCAGRSSPRTPPTNGSPRSPSAPTRRARSRCSTA